MFEKAYLIMGCTELLLLMILISKYIYFEQLLHHVRSWCIYLMLFLVCEVLVCFMNNEDLSQIALPFVFFSGMIFFTRKSKKIRGIFLTVPVTGMILSLVILPVSLIFLFSGSMISTIDHSTAWMWIYDILFLIGFFLFFWKVKRRLIRFKKQGEMQWIMFRNPVKYRRTAFLPVTSKEDYSNHGFGLVNIRMAVEKYKGHMEYRLEADGDLTYFVLEILLFVHSTT